jgi:tetratricopeptide (TPR) repeat protein
MTNSSSFASADSESSQLQPFTNSLSSDHAESSTRSDGEQTHAPANSNRRAVAVCIVLFAIVVLVFGQTVRFEFVNIDDEPYVSNPQVAGGLTASGIVWAFTNSHMLNWHPLTWLSHMTDCQLYGQRPFGHHLTSVLLHAATTIVLFLVLRQMTGELWPCALTAALFAVHPLRAESVAWVAERKDVLSGLFFVLTLAAYVHYVRHEFSLSRYLAPLALFACGLMAKQMLVTLPCVLMLLDWWPLQRLASSPRTERLDLRGDDFAARTLSFARSLVEKLPYFVLAAAASAATLFTQSEEIVISSHSLSTRVANALVACATYVEQFFLPHDLCPFYPHAGTALAASQVSGSLAALLIISIWAIAVRRKFPYFLVGWLWFLGMLIPVIGVVQVGPQAMADRYTYLPQIGLAIAVAWGLADLAKRWSAPSGVQAVLVGLLVAVLMVCSWRQTAIWRNSETLWRTTLARIPTNWVAHINLAAVLLNQNKDDEAISHYEAAVKDIPADTPQFAFNPYHGLGNVAVRQNRYDDAIRYYELAHQLKPRDPQPHAWLATVLISQGRTAEAMTHYEQLLELKPDDALAVNAHVYLGGAHDDQGDNDGAVSHYQKAVEIKPDSAATHCYLGIALDKQNKTEEAMDQYAQAIKLDEDLVSARFHLGKDLFQQGRFDEAVFQFEKAQQIEPNNAVLLCHLAIALAARGENAQALELYQRSIELDGRDAKTYYHAGRALTAVRRTAEAIEQYQAAVQIDPQYEDAQLALIDALAANSRRDAAIAECRRALERAESRDDQKFAQTLRERLGTIQSASPK